VVTAAGWRTFTKLDFRLRGVWKSPSMFDWHAASLLGACDDICWSYDDALKEGEGSDGAPGAGEAGMRQ
jgi:hypothetical protein